LPVPLPSSSTAALAANTSDEIAQSIEHRQQDLPVPRIFRCNQIEVHEPAGGDVGTGRDRWVRHDRHSRQTQNSTTIPSLATSPPFSMERQSISAHMRQDHSLCTDLAEMTLQGHPIQVAFDLSLPKKRFGNEEVGLTRRRYKRVHPFHIAGVGERFAVTFQAERER
jgi:hypothetical protein